MGAPTTGPSSTVNTVSDDVLTLTGGASLIDLPGANVTIQQVSQAIEFDATNWFNEVMIGVDIDTDFVIDLGQIFVKQFPLQEHVVSEVAGPLILEGGIAEGKDRGLRVAVMLSLETTNDPIGVFDDTDETMRADRLNLFNDGSAADESFTLDDIVLRNDIIKLGDEFALQDSTLVTVTNVVGDQATIHRDDSSSWDPGFAAGAFVAIDAPGVEYRLYEIVAVDGADLKVDGVLPETLLPVAAAFVLSDEDIRPMNFSGPTLSQGLVLDISEAQDGSQLVTIPGGITFDDIEVVDVLLGKGNDRLDVLASNTGTPGAEEFLITVVHGGGNTNVVESTTGTFTYDLAGNTTVSRDDAGGWAAGFVPGLHVRIEGSTVNTGMFEILEVNGSDLVLAGQLPAEGISVLVDLTVNGDTITVGADVDRADSPLVIFGDTTQDGSRYDSLPQQGGVTGNAYFFNTSGDDFIDTSASSILVAVSGGGGDDVIFGRNQGDHLAGGSGDDLIFALDGRDHVYGDSGFNIDYDVVPDEEENAAVARHLTVPTTNVSLIGTSDDMVAGQDELHGDIDIIFGDHGVILQAPGTERIFTTESVTEIRSNESQNGAGDLIFGGTAEDRIFGGSGGDVIHGNTGTDLIFGDHGFMKLDDDADGVDDTVDFMEAVVTINAGDDTIFGNEDNDIIIGGAGGDTIQGNGGNDLIFGDHGEVDQSNGQLDPTLLPFDSLLPAFRFEATNTQLMGNSLLGPLVSLGGDDDIQGNDGEDIILGQQGTDTIRGNAGDDDIIGGHNVVGGQDAGDILDGGTGVST